MTFHFDEGNITDIKGKGAEKNKLPVPFSIFRDKDPAMTDNRNCEQILPVFQWFQRPDNRKTLIATQRSVICRLAAGDAPFFIHKIKSVVLKKRFFGTENQEVSYDAGDYDFY